MLSVKPGSPVCCAVHNTGAFGYTSTMTKTFQLRAVVRESSGKTGLIVDSWPLRASTFEGAKVEADRRALDKLQAAPNALEIIDELGSIVAGRSFDRSGPWFDPGIDHTGPEIAGQP